ncbi:hypothetical protein CSA56_08795 [candidate division KSB3 bacterium]|uniref:Bacterial sugar transferase domain-containing protein n=1 Tax=candidate division KSB3 bacterium TaxID=2044937 RepID=A0A2G6KHD8_9BACT|nr:MAG: hypothetical protein CSA56_08795 [candidate division KSB3 bacterium]
MKTLWLTKIRLFFTISSSTRSIRDYINAMTQESRTSLYYEENKRLIIQKILEVVDMVQEFIAPEEPPPELPDYEKFSPEDVSLSLGQLLVLFRRTLLQLQQTPPKVQESALDILTSYFIELQGLYDLIFVSKLGKNSSSLPLSPSAIEEHQSRYLRLDEEFEHDQLIQEYRSVKYKSLMNTSLRHHLHVILFDILPYWLWMLAKESIQRTPRCQGILDPDSITSVGELRTLLSKHPLTESTKLVVALHRHTMRIFDLFFTKIFLKWGRPLFELLVLAIWIQTVKDHIVPEKHRPDWQAQHLDVGKEAIELLKGSGKIKMSSAFFMQPRIKFRLERFLIFKIRTMTVGDIVRTTELGNWMRQNSPDEFLQFFNVALGDMGGLGIRTMPEHEIMETKDTQWLYGALMSFIPGGMTSPGSIVMRKTNYGLTKSQQLLREILFYDPRFKGSSGLFTDIITMVKSILVLDKGRVGKALQKTESFTGKKRGF